VARLVSGRRIGRVVEPLLRGARRRLWVASPFISPDYARLLAEKASRGLDVRVVTSDAAENREAIRLLRSAGRRAALRRLAGATLASSGLAAPVLLGPRAPGLLLAALAGALGLYMLGRLLPLAALAAPAACQALAGGPGPRGTRWLGVLAACYYAACIALAAAALARGRGRGARLKVVARDRFLVHSKIIIADDTAVVGSANLTRTALWRNHETVTIYEPGEEGEAVEAFRSLWGQA
jgi:phosphatidylserine/phosphatidylglycerophosphate/cardiolipin synthase-like enzyme